ncbi:MAG: PASTA domain-containing protein, partial [Acidobacteria bacterium]|nr:PASTA domain-containing protein [Acidobacteriota bacterium]
MKLIAKLVFLALVLVMVAMISALTAMRFAIHGHEVTVPNFLGLTVAEAERLALARGLEFEVERQYYSPTVSEGKIMSQVPDAGTRVRRGWQLRVAQSLGPQRVAIPDLTGQTRRAAELVIERRGLEVGGTAAIAVSATPADLVIGQSPPPNSSGVAAPRISLLVSVAPPSPAYVMSNLVGQSLASASQIIQSAGLHLGRVNIAGGDSAASSSGSAISEAPSPSSLILS